MAIEFAARHFGGPLQYRSPNQNSPFEGLPIEAIAQMGGDGLLGMSYYVNHFHRWEGPIAEGAASGWVLTDATGTSTIAYGDVREGTIALTTDTTNNANPCLQLGSTTVGKQWGYTVGKRLWAFTRVKVSSVATGVQMFFGFGTPTTTPGNAAPTNGIFLRNGTTVNRLDLVAKEGANSTAKTNQITVAINTYYVLGFTVDVAGNVHAWLDGTEVTTGLIAVGSTGLATLNGDTTKTLQFLLNYRGPTTGAAVTWTMDWLCFGQDI